MELSSKLKLLIVNRDQFGYHVDPYKYSVYLMEDFEITHLSWDYGLPKIHQNGIGIKYISRRGFKLLRYLRFLRAIHNEIRNHAYDLVFMIYFPGCSLIRTINPSTTFNVDIRSRTVTNSPLKIESGIFFLLKSAKRLPKSVSLVKAFPVIWDLKKTIICPRAGSAFLLKIPKRMASICYILGHWKIGIS